MYGICVAVLCFVCDYTVVNVNGKVYTCGYIATLYMAYGNLVHIPNRITLIQV